MATLPPSLVVALAAGVLHLAACDASSASGLDGDRVASSLSESERSQLCEYEAELIAEGGTCDGAGQAPPSDICQDPDRFTDDMVCGYTVSDVEQCFQARLSDPCRPADPLGCQTIEDCECLDPFACNGLVPRPQVRR